MIFSSEIVFGNDFRVGGMPNNIRLSIRKRTRACAPDVAVPNFLVAGGFHGRVNILQHGRATLEEWHLPADAW